MLNELNENFLEVDLGLAVQGTDTPAVEPKAFAKPKGPPRHTT
jgi:hypothetical protein